MPVARVVTIVAVLLDLPHETAGVLRVTVDQPKWRYGFLVQAWRPRRTRH